MSGSDPTVLYLADRKGWLVSPRRLIKRDAAEWLRSGATALAGSYEVIESFSPFPDGPAKNRLKRWVCEQPGGCQEGSSFLIPLEGTAPVPSR